MRRTDRRGEPLTTTRPEPGAPRPRSRRHVAHVALVVPFVVLAMLLPACGGDDSGGGSGSTATQDPANLQGKSWVVTQILDPTYSVRFTAEELWGEGGEPGCPVHVDLWERYLEEDTP